MSKALNLPPSTTYFVSYILQLPGVVGLLQLGQYPDISFEWFTVPLFLQLEHRYSPSSPSLQGTASDGKLDIKSRVKTPLAEYGLLSQGMVQARLAVI